MRGYFLCIGAPKTGTTWLYEQLKACPQTYFTPEKEIHYFGSRFGGVNRLRNGGRFERLQSFMKAAARNFPPPQPDPDYSEKFRHFERNLNWFTHFARGPVNDDWYRGLFSEAGADAYACDFSPSTARIGPIGLKTLRKIHKTVKLAYILRNPADRLWSHLKFHAQFMGKTDEVLSYGTGRMIDFIHEHGLEPHGFYGTHLRNFLTVFRPGDIRVIDFADIVDRPADVLNGVTDFLGVPRMNIPAKAERAVNVSRKVAMPEGLMDPFRPRMLDEIAILEDLGYGFASGWRAALG